MATTLCTLQNLTLSFPHKRVFNEANFTLNEGDKIGVLGLNGHGKSSFFKLLIGEQPADKTVPAFIFDRNRDLTFFHVPQELPRLGKQTASDYFYEFYPEFLKVKKKLDAIALKFEDGDFSDALIHEQEKLYGELENLGEIQIHAQYMSYLRAFGFEGFEREVISLSGGEQRKIALALGLSCPHTVVLWDEPTNHLDVETIIKFEEELQSSTKTFMVISHDRSLLNNVVDRILHIHGGKLKSFQGTYADYLVFLQEEELKRQKTMDRLSNYHRRETAWIQRGAKARRTKSKKRIEDFGSLSQTIADLKAQAKKQVSLNMVASGRKTKILAQAMDVSLKLGGKTLFTDVNVTLAKGDKIALMGGNGVGKSSLLKLLMGEMAPTTGTMKIADGLQFGHFSQKREALPLEKTPWQLVGEGIDYVISNTGSKTHVTSYLENFLFSPDETKRPIHTFSGGEKNRLQLAQFMKHSQDLWIFDEPTNDLDLETIGILEEELKNYEGALVVVGHDRSFIENVATKCWLIVDGRIEIFETGWAQAEAYLEALALEKELEARKKTEAPKNKTVSKVSNKDRNRFEVVEKEIETSEDRVKTLEAALAAVDYSTGKAAMNLSAIQADLDKEIAKRDTLYKEWEQLDEKMRGET